MSLWHCEEHGLVGPEACCPQASRASLSEISASVPPEPPTLSDEPRAGRRRNTALPPIGDVSPHLCYECGGAHPLVVREKRMARWGQDPEVEIEDEWYRCPKCGDGYYTFEQAQAHERALWLATIAALRAEVAALRAVCHALDDVLAKRCLADANRGVEGTNDWPGGQQWDDLVGTSQSIMRHRAWQEAGLDVPAMIALLFDKYGWPKPFDESLRAARSASGEDR